MVPSHYETQAGSCQQSCVYVLCAAHLRRCSVCERHGAGASRTYFTLALPARHAGAGNASALLVAVVVGAVLLALAASLVGRRVGLAGDSRGDVHFARIWCRRAGAGLSNGGADFDGRASVTPWIVAGSRSEMSAVVRGSALISHPT